jgi:hypothetical protein
VEVQLIDAITDAVIRQWGEETDTGTKTGVVTFITSSQIKNRHRDYKSQIKKQIWQINDVANSNFGNHSLRRFGVLPMAFLTLG